MAGVVVLITGANAGIGKATAFALAGRGATVIMACRNLVAADAVAEDIRRATGNAAVRTIELDLADLGSVRQCAEQVPATGAGIDVLINNAGGTFRSRTLTPQGFERTFQVKVDVVVNTAGFGDFGRIVDLEAERFRAVVDCCLTGSFLVMKHAGRQLRDGGSLVSITSLNARLAAPGMSAYCSAKAGLAMLTQVAALEFAPRGIRVNAVSPGFVHTPLTELVTLAPGVLEDYVDNTPLGRVGTAQDVANAVLYLCSDKASWMTGEVIDLNGGAHLRRYPDVLGHVERMAQG